MTEWNAPNYLTKWMDNALSNPDLNPNGRRRLRLIGKRMIKQGKWRGNISQHWASQFPDLKPLLKDLYL